MSNFKDLTGLVFGRLTVIKRVEDRVQPSGICRPQWLCQCSCGNTVIVTGGELTRSNGTRSCGCLSKEISSKVHKTHGMTISNRALYDVWKGMIQRCENSKKQNYKYYGGRGISVCEEWHDVTVFVQWALLNGYEKGKTIDRIDNNGNYSPLNCRWVNKKEQSNNTRRNHFITYMNETHTLSEWANIFKIPYHTLKNRINRHKWSVEDAFTKPVRSSRRKGEE